MNTFQGQTIFFMPEVKADVGENAARVLQHIYFNASIHKNHYNGRDWYFNTQAAISEMLNLSVRSVRRAIAKLKQRGYIVVEKRERTNWYHRNWYALCMETVTQCFDVSRWGHFGSIHEDNLASSYTESLNQVNRDTDIEAVFSDQQGKEVGLTKPPPPIKKQDQKPAETDQGKQECKAIDPRVKQALKQVNCTLNKAIQDLLSATPVEKVLTAIAYIKDKASKGNRIRNPNGYLTKAVESGWHLIEEKQGGVPPDFNEWFELARKAGIVMASTEIDGVLCVCKAGGVWETYDEMRCSFGLPWLQKMLKLSPENQGIP